MLKLLCVTAHPDDEAGCFGGILAKYSEAGVECSVICLTAGERAANRGGIVPDEALKETRRKELADACKHLGVAHSQVLNYADGALDRADFNEVTSVLVRSIRQFRPQVVVSFGAEVFVTAASSNTASLPGRRKNSTMSPPSSPCLSAPLSLLLRSPPASKSTPTSIARSRLLRNTPRNFRCSPSSITRNGRAEFTNCSTWSRPPKSRR